MPISKTWPYLLVAASIVAIFFIGSNSGANSVQHRWDKQKIEDNKAYNKIKGEYDELNRKHSYETGQLSARLQTAKQEYENELSAVKSDYAGRLQQSTKRADIYQRQAQAGTLECRSLASHAARLDSSLEEGRQLVAELRATVRLRDGQLIELSNQIRADRKLFK